ncbi:MAG: dipicolinate synthase subunit DpsA [Ruminococcaceae bacterium]|nr:dipicolinate synthase subunit DpsA [Oscillospiraceae bacterium]
MKTTVFAVIGGDVRYVRCADFFCSLGAEVRTFGFDPQVAFDEQVITADSLACAIQGADYILLPLPVSVEKGLVNTPLYQGTISLNSVSELISHDQVVFGGKMDNTFLDAIRQKGVLCHDYTEYEDFSVLNAIPTAEGALEIAMRELPVTLHGASCLVIGFGRIAKVLCHNLLALGAHVTAAARKQSDRTWMQTFGYIPIHTKDLQNHIGSFQLIINTAPVPLLTRDVLSHINKEALIIDLASRPGGVDFESAEKLGIKVIWALSLPGKVAPRTAGDIICKTILNIINDSEVKV